MIIGNKTFDTKHHGYIMGILHQIHFQMEENMII